MRRGDMARARYPRALSRARGLSGDAISMLREETSG